MGTTDFFSTQGVMRRLSRNFVVAAFVSCAATLVLAQTGAPVQKQQASFRVVKALTVEAAAKVSLGGGMPQMLKPRAGAHYLLVQLVAEEAVPLPITIDLLGVKAADSNKAAVPLLGLDFLLGDQTGKVISVSATIADQFNSIGDPKSDMELTINNLGTARAVLTIRKPKKVFSFAFEVPKGQSAWVLQGLGQSPLPVAIR